VLRLDTGAPDSKAGQTSQNFPTQDITDHEVVEIIPVHPEAYTPLAIETPHPQNAATGLNLILVAQDPSEPQTNPPSMRRVYRTLPGAWVTDTRIDPDGVVVLIKTRKALSRLIVSAETLLGSPLIWTKTTNGPGGDAVLGDEVQETRAIPGNPVPSTKLDEDGAKISEVKTMVDATTIVTAEAIVTGVWIKTTAEAISDLVAWKIVTSRAIPGNPVPSTKLDEDGATLTETKTFVDLSTVTTAEGVSSGVWTRTSKQAVTELVGWKVVTTRPLPGNPVTSKKPDPDGALVTIVKTLKDTSTITPGEPAISGGVWTETVIEPVSQLVAHEVYKSRALPGGTMVVGKLEVDGANTIITRTLREQTTITPGESLLDPFTTWTKTTKEDPPVFRGFELRGGSHVAWEIVETRAIPGNVLTGTSFTKDGDKITETKRLVQAASISASSIVDVSNIWTKIFQEPYPGSALIAWQVTQTRTSQNVLPFYSKEIPDLVPAEFRFALPTTTTETDVIGTASAIGSLGTGDIYISQQQLDQYTYRLKVTTRGSLSLPQYINSKEWIEEYGGTNCTRTLTLDLTSVLTALESGANFLIVSCTITNLGNGLSLRNTLTCAIGAWPDLIGNIVDETLGLSIPYAKQVISSGTGAPGINVGTGVARQVRPIDSVRDELTITSFPVGVGAGLIENYALIFAGNTSVDFPPELISVDGIAERTTAGAGSYSDIGSYSISGNGSGGVNLHGEAQGSAAVITDATYVIKQIWGRDVPCMNYLFFVPSGTSRANIITKLKGASFTADSSLHDSPDFDPEQVTIFCRGEKITAKLVMDASAHDTMRMDYTGTQQGSVGSIRTNGSGGNIDAEVELKAIRIQSTIHKAITVSQPSPLTQTAAATGRIGFGMPTGADTGSLSLVGVALTATGSISATIPQTDGIYTYDPADGTHPFTGNYVVRLISEPYKFGYIKVHAEVVSAGDIN
jgi:hypothetical protein